MRENKEFRKFLIDKIEKLLQEVDELVKILGSSIITLRGKRVI